MVCNSRGLTGALTSLRLNKIFINQLVFKSEIDKIVSNHSPCEASCSQAIILQKNYSYKILDI